MSINPKGLSTYEQARESAYHRALADQEADSCRLAELTHQLLDLLSRMQDRGVQTYGEINPERRQSTNDFLNKYAKEGEAPYEWPLDAPYWFDLTELADLLRPLTTPLWNNDELWPEEDE